MFIHSLLPSHWGKTVMKWRKPKQHLEDRVESYQPGAVFPVAYRQVVPDNTTQCSGKV
jgi:hypothetical protein